MIKSSILLILCFGYISAEDMTDMCLGCICQASSGCRQSLKCTGDQCGMFLISKFYWIDAGQPTINGQSPEENDAHPNCSNDPFCAAQAVHGYMKKLAKDCNGDGIINCDDYMAMHRLGGYNCTGPLPADYVSVTRDCIASAGTPSIHGK